MMQEFEYEEDRAFFEELVLGEGSPVTADYFHQLFDFSDPRIKRKEFGRVRNRHLDTLIDQFGRTCMLGYECCDLDSGFAVDHIIPISSNKLNKRLRQLKAEPKKKVRTQSYGSNNLENLIIACNNCNNHKKHRLLDRDRLHSILKRKIERDQ